MKMSILCESRYLFILKKIEKVLDEHLEERTSGFLSSAGNSWWAEPTFWRGPYNKGLVCKFLVTGR